MPQRQTDVTIDQTSLNHLHDGPGSDLENSYKSAAGEY